MKVIKIKGMSCSHCAAAVKKALSEIDGIENVEVDLERGEASFDEVKTVEMEIIKRGIEKAGYEVA